MSILSNANAMSSEAYVIGNSLRFQAASSQYLSRTPSSASNRKTWTYSAWIKKGSLTSSGWILGAGTAGSEYTGLVVSTTVLQMNVITASTNRIVVATNAVFRDPSAWYHIVLAVDTTQATNSNGVKMYVNGVQQTLTFTNYTQNVDTAVNNTTTHTIGQVIGVEYFDGYMAEVNFIDGQQLTPSSFGYNNPYTGVWVAKKYTGSYGTNGFYLPFSNGTSTATLGVDYSGNNNNWNLNSFTRSAGVSDCWMKDVPSGNGYRGLSASSNYAVLNPLDVSNANPAISAANLRSTNAATGNRWAKATIQFSSGKFYWEMTLGSVPTGNGLGPQPIYAGTYSYYNAYNGQIYINGSLLGTYATSTTNDVIGIAFDRDLNTVSFYKNNTLLATGTGITAGDVLPQFFTGSVSTTEIFNVNFGQRSFAYTPPTGFLPLCTANLPVPTILQGNKFMDATLYSGNSTVQNVANTAGFSPDLVWIKNRSSATDNILNDTVRGAGNYLISNLTNTETTNTIIFSAFNSNGFQLNNAAQTNASGSNYVAWQWDAGTTTVTNTNGTISSQVRANPTTGVSVVTWTPTASAGTIGHGLGVAPKMIVMKDRQNSYQWFVYHASIGAGKYLGLNTTTATTTNATVFSTTPTSSVFDPGTGLTTGNLYGNQVAYCFAEIAGFSKFGSYTGNGSADGTFVYCGFLPKYILIKRTDAAGYNWKVGDTSRDTYNVADKILYPNLANGEGTGSGQYKDFVSNGFKLRTTDSDQNASGGTYIYMAFAENPFNFSNAR